jgi:hypothetical protein
MELLSQCELCRHFLKPTEKGERECEAFEQIPPELYFGPGDHRKAFAGDNGIRWQPKEGADHPFDQTLEGTKLKGDEDEVKRGD